MKTIATKSMLIGLLLASTIFFGMAAGDVDDKKIEQLEKAIAAAETKEQRDKLFAQLNALLEPQKPKKKPGTVLWEFETGDKVYSSPAITSDGTVYVGSADKKLYAINSKSGAKLWEFETGGDVGSSPAIGSDGTV